MIKKFLFLLLLAGISLCGCKNTTKDTRDSGTVANINKDFPITEKLKFTPLATLNARENIEGMGILIDESTAWFLEEGKHDFGCCYDLTSGEMLATIATIGDAPYELKTLEGFNIVGDSVLLHEDQASIKTFSKKDIINNLPGEKRKYSITKIPDDILVSYATKLPDGSVLATIRPAMFKPEQAKEENYKGRSVLLIREEGIKTYTTINSETFNVGEAKKNELPADELVRWTFAQGLMATKGNDMAVFSAHGQFILYTLDLNSGKVMNEKRYTNILRDGGEMSFCTTNEKQISIQNMRANDKYILCEVTGFFNEEEKTSGHPSRALFIFDWNLNPIKKFDLPTREGSHYSIDTDCSAIYFCKFNNGLTLYKADLNL